MADSLLMPNPLETIGGIILLQELLLGVFSTGGLIFALLLLFGRLQWAREKFGTLWKASSQAPIVGDHQPPAAQPRLFVDLWKAPLQALIVGVLTLFLIYFLGVTTHYLAGRWIDKPSCWHLGLKSLWNEYDDGDMTDARITCEMYLHAFGCDENLCKGKDENNVKKVREWYFQVYSPIILYKENKEFREYIHYAQKRVNLARLWAFVSFVILVACLLRPLFWLLLYILYRKLCPEFSWCAVLRVAAIAGVAVMIYFVSVHVWVGAEKSTSARVWRFAKSFPGKATAWERRYKDKCSPLKSKTTHSKSPSPKT